MKLQSRRRPGVALIVVLVMLTVLATGSAAVAWNRAAARRFLLRRENAMQAEWLARSGIELAYARAARNQSPPADWRPLGERAIVRISVSDKDGKKNVTAEATYPADESQPAVREATSAMSIPKR